MDQRGSNWIEMGKSGPKLTELDQIDRSGLKWSDIDQSESNRLKLTKIELK